MFITIKKTKSLQLSATDSHWYIASGHTADSRLLLGYGTSHMLALSNALSLITK
jgi:hypothetical protein